MEDPAEQEVDQHDSLFTKPLRFFASYPYNDIFLEKRESEIYAIPKDKFSEVYTFTHGGNSIGLLKTSDAELSATLSIHSNDDVISTINANLVPPPIPLRTLWKTSELKLNDSLVTPSGNFAYYSAYFGHLLKTTPEQYEDSPQINCGYFDTGGSFDDVIANNLGRAKRRTLTNNTARCYLLDYLDLPCFNQSGGEEFLLSAFKIEVKLARADKRVVCLATTHVDLPIGEGKIALSDLKLKIPVFKPNDQLADALNTSFITDEKEAKYYTSTLRTVTETIPAGKRTIIVNDIFNGSCPVRLFVVMSRQDNFNGTADHNCFRFRWENWSSINVAVNNVSIGTITSSIQAYNQLRKVLNKRHSKMPFSYADFLAGYAIIGFDLTSNEDTHLKVLPNRPSGVVDIHLEYSQNTVVGTMLFIGEFRNEIKVGITTPARSLYNF